MNNNTIVLADYIGNSNRSGEISGHLLKALRDLHILLSGELDLKYAICENYVPELPNADIVISLKRISACRSKVMEIIQRAKNIKEIFRTGENIWFVNIDLWFFLIILFLNTRKKKIIITNYIDYSNAGWVRKAIYLAASKKINCEFTTAQKRWKSNQVFIPDYWFDESFYTKYVEHIKLNQVVFCGGISRTKSIIELIKAFKKNGQKLIIKGKFESEALFEEARNEIGQSENITVENRRLGEDEYYSLIGSSRFIVLPYKRENYAGRSSGVILESVFLGTTIIAPQFLLRELGISGIGYDNMSELEEFSTNDISNELLEQISVDNEKEKDNYSKDRVRDIYIKSLGGEKK